jgi:hypothetical protein
MTLVDLVQGRVEHERDAGQRLDRPVVQEDGEPSPLVLLGRDELVGQPCALEVRVAANR